MTSKIDLEIFLCRALISPVQMNLFMACYPGHNLSLSVIPTVLPRRKKPPFSLMFDQEIIEIGFICSNLIEKSLHCTCRQLSWAEP
jgi:hypothetical protein